MKRGHYITYTGEKRAFLKPGAKYMLKFDVRDEIVCIYVFGLIYRWINIDETDLLNERSLNHGLY